MMNHHLVLYPGYLKVPERLSPEQGVGVLQLKNPEHDEQDMDAEGSSDTATSLQREVM
jgi:hypothetical protein